ncbi:hypothetical protein AB0B83_19150 [Micromonospora sp. NPDC049060]
MTKKLQVVTIVDIDGRRGAPDPPPAEIDLSPGRPISPAGDV